MSKSNIEWTEDTQNFVVGCDKQSPGCENCYAMRMAWRLSHNPKMKGKYEGTVIKTAGGKINWTGKINFDSEALFKPESVKKPTTYFVNSMSDLFHPGVSNDIRDNFMVIVAITPHHTYQVLTKQARPMFAYFHNGAYDRLLQLLSERGLTQDHDRIKAAGFLPNLHLGVSVENQRYAQLRIPLLLRVPAAVRFLSCEPLLGPLDITVLEAPDDDDAGASRIWPLTGERTDMGRPCQYTGKLHWVIVGGESGPNSRPMHPDWVREIRDQCKTAGVAFFFKQWGAFAPHMESKNAVGIAHKGLGYTMALVGKKKAGRELDGKTHNEMPNRK